MLAGRENAVHSWRSDSKRVKQMLKLEQGCRSNIPGKFSFTCNRAGTFSARGKLWRSGIRFVRRTFWAVSLFVWHEREKGSHVTEGLVVGLLLALLQWQKSITTVVAPTVFEGLESPSCKFPSTWTPPSRMRNHQGSLCF